MAQVPQGKDLPLLPPKMSEESLEKTKHITRIKSIAENYSAQNDLRDSKRSADPEKPTQRRVLRPGPEAVTRTKTIDRLMTILEESPTNNFRKDIDMVLSVIERMDVHNPSTVVPQTEMVVRIYHRLEKAQRDRSKADSNGSQISKEDMRWEREVERRLRAL